MGSVLFVDKRAADKHGFGDSSARAAQPHPRPPCDLHGVVQLVVSGPDHSPESEGLGGVGFQVSTHRHGNLETIQPPGKLDGNSVETWLQGRVVGGN